MKAGAKYATAHWKFLFFGGVWAKALARQPLFSMFLQTMKRTLTEALQIRHLPFNPRIRAYIGLPCKAKPPDSPVFREAGQKAGAREATAR